MIREIRLEDEPFLWEMLYQAIYVAPGQPTPPRAVVREPELARYVVGWGRPGDYGVLALEAATQAPAGAAWLRLFPRDAPGYGTLDEATPELSIAVLPTARGKGAGTEMLAALLDYARTRYPAVSLSVSAGNPAGRLYRRFGFEVVRRDGDALVMKAELRGG